MTNILRKAHSRVLALCFLFFLLLPRHSHAQCAAAPIAAAACSGGNGAASDGLSITTGKTYWISSSPTFSGITLNGGTLRICGSPIISTITINSGTLIVEHGGSLIAGSFGTFNGGATIINRGSIITSGGLTMQNSNNYIYNDLSTSVFTMSGTLNVNSSTSYIINRGTMTLASLTYQGPAGGFCVQDQSITNLGGFTSNTTNGFGYSGSGSTACVSVTGTVQLNHTVTNSSNIHVCQQNTATVTGAGGWGSAVVQTNCTSCATVLPLTIDVFTATKQGAFVQLQWVSGLGSMNSGIFYAEKSTDGVNFETLGSVATSAGVSEYSLMDGNITSPKLYYRIHAVSSTGATFYSMVSVVESVVDGQLQLFPNPAGPSTNVTIVIPALSNGSAQISLIDMAGQVLSTKMAALSTGSNTLSWKLRNLAPGIYLLRVALPGGNLYGRLAVRSN